MKSFVNLTTFLLIFVAFLSQPTIAQSWGAVGTGTDGPVHCLNNFGQSLSIGGKFKLINSFNRVNHCLVRENFLNNYTYFFTFTEDFNTPQSGGSLPGTAIYASAPFNNRLHVGGKFYHESSLENIGIGYMEEDPSSGFTSFHSYSHTIADSQAVLCFKSFDDKLFFGGSFTNLNGANFIAYIETNDYPTPTIKSSGNQINGTVRTLEVFENTLYAGGDFLALDSDSVVQSHIAKWNGSDWELVGKGLNANVYTLFPFEGLLYAGGAFTASDSLPISKLAKWNGMAWSQAGPGFVDSTDTVFSIASYDDTLFIAGRLKNPQYTYLKNITMLVNNDWKVFAVGPSGPIYAMEAYRGKLYIGGDFQKVNTQVFSNLVTYHNGNASLGVSTSSMNPKELTLFPSPCDEVLHIESIEEINEISILSSDGVIHRTIEQNSNSSSLKTSDLPAGHYQVIATYKDDYQTTKPFLIIH